MSFWQLDENDMPIKVTGCVTAHAFIHDNTWDYVCKHCLNEGEDVKMTATSDGKGKVAICCPRCGTMERIDLPSNNIS
jgi:RNase P subunit RPR2